MRFSVVASIAVLGFAASPALAAERTYVKAGATAQTMDADRDACVQKVLAWINGPTSPFPRVQNPTTDQIIAHAVDMRGPRAAAKAEVQCMADKGYVSLPLTKEEAKALGKTHGMAEREAWYDRFVAADLSARIAAVPPLD
ncbi:hypothetical protein BH09PSE4_BH09PSE4_18000 [soil metagenome]